MLCGERMQIKAIFIAVILLLSAIVMLYTDDARGETLVVTGDWNLASGSNVVHSGNRIEMNGNLVVSSNAVLTLKDVDLVMGTSSSGNYIKVESGGTLVIQDLDSEPGTTGDASVVSAADTSYPYMFYIESGATLTLKNSVVKNAGKAMVDSSDSGLDIESDKAEISGCEFSDDYCGLYIKDADPTVTGCMFRSNDYGIYVSSGAAKITDNTFTQNTYGLLVGSGSTPDIRDNRITKSSNWGLKVEGSSTKAQMTGNVISNNSGSGVILGSFQTFDNNVVRYNDRNGMEFLDCKNKQISECDLSGNTDADLFLENSEVTLYNCTYKKEAFKIDEDYNLTVIYPLRVGTLDHYLSPMADCDVKVFSGIGDIYKTAGFGGKDPKTSVSGWTSTMDVTSKIFEHKGVLAAKAMTFPVTVNVSNPGTLFKNCPRTLQMTKYSYESFVAKLPLRVWITSPTAGVTLNKTIAVSGGSENDDGSVQSVEVKFGNGSWMPATGTTTWSYSWNTTAFTNGQITILARAKDASGYSPEASVTITLNNTIPVVTDDDDVVSDDDDSGVSGWVIAAIVIGIIVLVVVIVTVIIVIVFLGKKKGKKDERSEHHKEAKREKPPAPKDDDEPGDGKRSGKGLSPPPPED